MSAARKRKKSLRESLVVELVDCIANPQEKAKRKKQNNDVAERAGGQPEAELSTKSLLCLTGEKNRSCLLFLAAGQKICMKGKAEVSVLAGAVHVLGYRIQQGHQPCPVFSPSTSSLITLRECGASDDQDSPAVRDLGVVKKVLKDQNRDIAKKGMARAKKAASVLLLCSFTHPEVDFVCQFPPFQGIFKDTTREEDVEAQQTEVDAALQQRTSKLGFTLLNPDPRRWAAFTCPDQWTHVAGKIEENLGKTCDGQRSPVVLLCGGKNVGKSTFARYLMNSALNRMPEVYFLECDTGQTEFTPPAILSLNKVTFPVLGSPFTHLSKPVKSCFFGDVTPRDNPEFYVSCIQYLYEFYTKTCGGQLLIINTQGWVTGMGVPLLLDVLMACQPSHVVQFRTASYKDLPSLAADNLNMDAGWLRQNSIAVAGMRRPTQGSTKDDDFGKAMTWDPVIFELDSVLGDDANAGSKYRASDQRTLALLSYFGRLSGGSPSSTPGAWSLSACVPFHVPWSRVAVHVMHTEVHCSQVLYSLNASIVGLAVAEPSKMIDKGEGAPKFLEKASVMDCVGLGIVRNIDPTNKLFFIVTPVPRPELTRVNTLLKGNLELPAAMFLQQTERDDAPYVSSEFSSEFRGAGARKVRYNLLRRKHSSPGRPTPSVT